MKDGICPKCRSSEIMTKLRLIDSQNYPPYVQVLEPEPPNRPFIWMPQSERSQFEAYVCAACGYTEFYAISHQALRAGWIKGFRSK